MCWSAFFDEELGASITHLYYCIEMFTVNATTVYEAVKQRLTDDDIPFSNLISILSDSAAYMRGSSNGFQLKMKSDAPHMLDVDGDVCHHVHNIVKFFSRKVDEDGLLPKLLNDISNDMKFSADLKADLFELCELLGKLPLSPVDRIEHRWLSLLHAGSRFHVLIEPPTVFYYAFMNSNDKELYKDTITKLLSGLGKRDRGRVFAILYSLREKSLTPFGKARNERIYKKLFYTREQTLGMMHFRLDTSPIFKTFVLSFENAEPKMHQLYDEVLKLCRLFLGNFVKAERLIGKNLSSFQLDAHKLKSPKDIFIGEDCSKLLKDKKKDFCIIVKEAYVATAGYMLKIKKLPLANGTLKCLASIDPTAHGHYATNRCMKKLGRLFPTVLSTSVELTQFDIEVDRYHITPVVVDDRRLDVWWREQQIPYS